jgi:hypothetical protein
LKETDMNSSSVARLVSNPSGLNAMARDTLRAIAIAASASPADADAVRLALSAKVVHGQVRSFVTSRMARYEAARLARSMRQAG